MEPPLYQQLAEAVMELFRQGRLLQDIADTLQVDRNTVTSAIRWWHESRGLPVPDGRTRCKELDVKTSPKAQDQAPELQTPPPQDQPEGGEELLKKPTHYTFR